jgi:hypothetical protein
VPKFEFFIPYEESNGLMGVSRCGKSKMMKEWNAFMMAQKVGLVWWDAKDEHTTRGRRGVRNGPLTQRFTVPEFHAAFDRDRRVITRKDLALGIVPSSPFLTPEQRAKEFRSILPRILGRGRCVFGIEECGQLVKAAEKELVEIASVWPEDVSSIFVGQVPTMFPTQVRANWFRCISFVQAKASDRQTLAADFGWDFANALEHLGRGECLVGLSRPGWAVTGSTTTSNTKTKGRK